MGIFLTFGAIARIVGPILGGAGLDFPDKRTIFLINAGLWAVIMALMLIGYKTLVPQPFKYTPIMEEEAESDGPEETGYVISAPKETDYLLSVNREPNDV